MRGINGSSPPTFSQKWQGGRGSRVQGVKPPLLCPRRKTEGVMWLGKTEQ